MVDELLRQAIATYNSQNDILREQMKGRAHVPTWEGLPYFHKLIVLDNVITTATPCFALHHPTKIEYYIGKQKKNA
jgi:hypothetical protein